MKIFGSGLFLADLICRRIVIRGRVLDQVNGTVNDTQKKILKELEKNPNITYDELVDKIDTSRRTIIRQMNGLKEKGIVKRVGSDKKGHWEIVERE
jgi:predicted HTH transcriptional regulator